MLQVQTRKPVTFGRRTETVTITEQQLIEQLNEARRSGDYQRVNEIRRQLNNLFD